MKSTMRLDRVRDFKFINEKKKTNLNDIYKRPRTDGFYAWITDDKVDSNSIIEYNLFSGENILDFDEFYSQYFYFINDSVVWRSGYISMSNPQKIYFERKNIFKSDNTSVYDNGMYLVKDSIYIDCVIKMPEILTRSHWHYRGVLSENCDTISLDGYKHELEKKFRKFNKKCVFFQFPPEDSIKSPKITGDLRIKN
jgi:hypothetical protein